MKLNDALFTVLVFALLSCSGEKGSDQEDVVAIREFLSHTGVAVNSGDVEAEVNRFTEDGIYMWPGRPSIEGHDSLRAWFRHRFSKVDVDLECKSLELRVCGDWAFERGVSVAQIMPKSGGEVSTVRGKYLNVLRKQADGSWRIARRIRNNDHEIRK
jgi:uncharacterized protein (TIGR02246 family)